MIASDWLVLSNMTSQQGLFVDSCHFSGFGRNGSIVTEKCDERNEMVYSSNQGVVLSSRRGLWESTGRTKYLEDSHALIRSVIAATGWRDSDTHDASWSGLGRNGIIEDFCDARGNCSKDVQPFKGIYFHDLTQFCKPLPREPCVEGKTHGATPAEYAFASE